MESAPTPGIGYGDSHGNMWTSWNYKSRLLLGAADLDAGDNSSGLEAGDAGNNTATSFVWSGETRERVAVVGLIMVCTIVGNTLMILMLMCKPSRRRKRVNVFLTNLALGDIAVALLTNSTEILFLVFDDWALGVAFCKISVYLQIVTLASATFLLTAMSVDRYQVIVRPMQSLANRPRIWVKVTLAWAMAFVFASPQLLIFVLREQGEKYDGTPKRVCVSKGYTAEWQRKVYMTFMAVYILVLPAILMLFCYARIIWVVWARARTDGPREGTSGEGEETSGSPRMSVRRGLVTASKRRVIVMTLTVIIGFLVCVTPYFIVSLVRVYSNYTIKLTQALAFAETIFMLHSALNPVLYGLFTLRMHHLKWLLRLVRCSKNSRRKPSEKNRLLNGGSEAIGFKMTMKRQPKSTLQDRGGHAPSHVTHAVVTHAGSPPRTVVSRGRGHVALQQTPCQGNGLQPQAWQGRGQISSRKTNVSSSSDSRARSDHSSRDIADEERRLLDDPSTGSIDEPRVSSELRSNWTPAIVELTHQAQTQL